MQQLGAERVLVVHGQDGMDEISLGAATLVGELRDGVIREYVIHPEDFGMAMASNRSLRVANADESKAMLLDALANIPGTPREIVVLNAGAALYAAGIAETLTNGIERARAAIASGDARRRLDLFIGTTRTLAEGGRAGE
jgi:anthranilate phosphoribosyltransferase